MRVIDLTNVFEINVSPEQSMDSWYPGYSWSILVCTGCGDAMHIGWKFSSPVDSFYGIIVGMSGQEEAEKAGKGSLAENVLEQLKVGLPAPAWMLALLATATPAK